MTALLLSLAWKFWPVIAAVVGFLGTRIYYERKGAAKERAKREAADRLVNDLADDVQSDIGSMSAEQRREELRKWAKR